MTDLSFALSEPETDETFTDRRIEPARAPYALFARR